MRKVLTRILGLAVVLGTIWFGVTHGNFLAPVGTAFAVGDLLIDWNVPAGDPIFVVNDFAPGEMESRNVEVTNSGTIPREVGVRGVQTGGLGALEGVLEITISEGVTDLYGGTSSTGTRTLSQFFTDSTNPNGITLLTVDPSETVVLTFKVKFAESAGNEFQNANVVFDITLGITGEVAGIPAECAQIDFAGDPIFGTDSGDLLRGTAGNDLIFGLEGGDAIYGNGGDDCIVGGPGPDYINGRSGNDVLLGNEGPDALLGEGGNDAMFGGTENDSLEGGSGNDTGRGGEGSDSFRGGDGTDVGFGAAGNDGLRGGGGNDQLFGVAGQDAAQGDSGVDTCEAEAKTACEL